MSAESAKRSNHGRGSPVKNPGPPHRKQTRRLAARIADYARMVQDSSSAASKRPGSFHQPGSHQ